MYKRYIKRLLDLCFGMVILILLIPLMLIISIFVYHDFHKIIFKQKRVGKNKKTFIMYKFQTMYRKNNINKDANRTTKISRIFRNLGLDEIPQLLNIVKGDMSFIGPRPFIYQEKLPTIPNDKLYSIKPGLTGLAQASGRRSITHDDRLNYDYYYIDNVCFKLDLKILLKTFTQIFKDNI